MGHLWLGFWIAVAPAVAVQAPEVSDTRYGYALSAPDLPGPRPGGNVVRLTFAAAAEGGFSSNLNVMVQEVRMSRADYAALSRKQFASAGLTVRSMTDREVSGRPAILVDYEGEMAGRALRFLSLAVILPERILLATCTAPNQAFPGLEAEFRRSLESFRLTAP
jgi:hypothetical protein